MPLRANHLAWLLIPVAATCAPQSEPDAATTRAIAALRSGDLASAETTLQSDLRSHPRDPIALEVLAAVLDQEKKYPEAVAIYQRALAVAPRSPGLLNNYGNHLLATGKPREAQAAFTKVLAIDPAHPNANLQLARLAIQQKDPARAARFLQHFTPDTIAGAPEAFALGLASSAAGQHARAAAFFARTLELQPDNFDALYDLGLAASHAGDYPRAQSTLQRALERQPDNVDFLCDLAAVDLQQNRSDTALELLVRARQLAPDRASVALLLARATSQLGDFGDAVQAWDAYLKLNPGPNPDADTALRERAFAQTAIGQDLTAALDVLRAYAQKHPDDATGQYELGAAESPTGDAPALEALTRALALKPDFAAAHLARGLLLYRQNHPDRALADFQRAATLEPHNPTILRRLGQTYTALNRPADALRVLRTAETLAPQDPAILLQLARALSQSGRDQEAAPVFARYRQLAAAHPHTPSAGLLDFLTLSTDEQLARYRSGVERAVQKNPENAEAQVRYLALLLNDRKIAEALAVSQRITALQPDARILEPAISSLLDARQFDAAAAMLQHARERNVTSPELELDSAIAAHDLAALDRIPPASRTPDFHLIRAQLLEDRNLPADSELAIALQGSPAHSASAAQSFLAHNHAPQALRILDRAIAQHPGDPRLRLLHALAATLAGQNPAAEFLQIENRWPEWSAPWVADQARQALETAKSQADPTAIAQATTQLQSIPQLF